MELIDIIRSEYHYQDEYILSKTFCWLYNSCELIRRRKYNEQVENAMHIARAVAEIFSKDKNSNIKLYDELFIEEETKIVPDDFEVKDNVLKNLGLAVKK